MTKTCRRCNETKPAEAFYEHPKMRDGRLNVCADCVRLRVRAYYRETKKERVAYERARAARPVRRANQRLYAKRRRERTPEKHAARTAVNNAVRDGKLRRLPCERCGEKRGVQGHHHDYSKPLDVEWLCFKCHRAEHGQTVVAA